MKPHIKQLRKLGACKEAITWADQFPDMAGFPPTLEHLAAPCQPLSVASGSRLFVFDDGTDGLTYIAESPAPEHGGFHPHTVAIAKGAIEEIARLHALLDDLYEGRSAVLPKTPKHARELILIAEACLKSMSSANSRDEGRAGGAPSKTL